MRSFPSISQNQSPCLKSAEMTDSDTGIWKDWNGAILFCVNITCLIVAYVTLKRRIDAHVCQKCTKEHELIQSIGNPIRGSSSGITQAEAKDAHCQKYINQHELNQSICNSIRKSSLAVTPITQAEDSETDSSETSDYSDTEEKQDTSKLQTITYTTVHFNNKKQVTDYENIVETPDYVNVDLDGTTGKNKKLKKKVQSVDYTTVVPMSVPFKRPSHPQDSSPSRKLL
ncbi:uncharacterized protein LOC130357941 isoform X2 [Hyla sarda]|uniref:uncharacterized protein LOC130357941 isoform X2 n=1 Tax=Hyla sarda TaxID=327740 RepID=UPI0024C2F7B0|nr:uncharacterized protein LOC130357941 isoform X2 [Hyla sarda]